MRALAFACLAFGLVAACEGPPGPIGPEGPSGALGADGTDGEDGTAGANGSSGAGTGSNGAAGRDGAAGENGADGTDGTNGSDGAAGASGLPGRDGVNGTNGMDGADGKDGADGAPAPTYRYDCKWCTPQPAGYPPQCAANQKALQRCVADGDGCGHYQLVQQCEFGCGYAYGNELDSLGNRTAGAAVCKPSASVCGKDILCPSGQACDYLLNACAEAPTWLTASATLNTNFDGQAHTFQAFAELTSASCSQTSGSYWDVSTSRRCSLLVGPATWSASSAGNPYAGHPITVSYFNVETVSGLGAQTVTCSGAGLTASLFTSRLRSCTLTISSMDLQPGGFIAGSFARADYVTRSGQPADSSSLSTTGAFRVQIAAAAQ